MKSNGSIISDDFLSELSQLKIIQKRKSTPGDLGQIQSRQSGGQIDFQEHRLYQKGDEPRHIDWNVYNRLKQLTVKVFSKQETSENFIVIDASASMEFTKNSKGLKASQIAAAIAYLNLCSENSVQIYWHNFSFHKTPKMQGEKSIFPLLKTISDIQFGGTANITKALNEISQKNRKGNISILSDFYDSEEILRTISQISPGRFTVNLFQILCLQEINFPQTGLFTLQDSESVEQKKIRITQNTRKNYAEHIVKFTEDIKKTAQHLHCNFYQINADAPFEETIQTLRQHHFFS